MIGLVWNCRDISQSAVIQHLRSFISIHRPDVVFLSETKKISLPQMSNLVSILGFDSCEIFPALGRSGGLTFMWNANINIKVILSNSHNITCLVLDDPPGNPWQIPFVYGPPMPLLRANFWDNLTEIGDSFRGPW